MKTLDNLAINSSFSTLEVGPITICPSPTSTTWKWTLPPDDGTVGQFMTTDGSGVTSWTSQAASSINFTGPGVKK